MDEAEAYREFAARYRILRAWATDKPDDAPEPPAAPYWVFTFGGGQRLRSTPSRMRTALGWEASPDQGAGGELPIGLPLRARYVRISATSELHARAIMVALFGQCWASQYPDEAAAEVRRHRLTELDVTEALAELAKMPDAAVSLRDMRRDGK